MAMEPFMLDDLKNLNLGDLLKQAQSMQGQVQQMQEELARKTVTADPGAGDGAGHRQRADGIGGPQN